VKWDQHPGIPIHCHPVDKVVARLPASGMRELVRTPVPIGASTLDRAVFDTIDMGLPATDLRARCGAPDVIDAYAMPGVQFGVAEDAVVDGYMLELWFYGRAVMYVINGRVWGRALYESEPERVSYGTQG
jgi:tellurite methyltransferase